MFARGRTRMAELKSSMRVEGLKELQSAMRDFPDLTRKLALRRSITAGSTVIRNEARRLAPVLSTPTRYRTAGLLRKMIVGSRGVLKGYVATSFVRVRRIGRKLASKLMKKTGKTGAELDPFYWFMLEFGTSKMGARPFMRPAFDAKKGEAVAKIKDTLAKEIDAIAKKLYRRKF